MVSQQVISEARYQATFAEIDAFMDTPDAYTMVEFRARPGQPIRLQSQPVALSGVITEWIQR